MDLSDVLSRSEVMDFGEEYEGDVPFSLQHVREHMMSMGLTFINLHHFIKVASAKFLRHSSLSILPESLNPAHTQGILRVEESRWRD